MADQLFLAMDGALRGIGKGTWAAAFLDWMPRLRNYIEANGDYFEGD
jgi:hypothetical protein